MFRFFQVVFLVGIGFLFGQSAFPVPAEAGVVDRVVEELHGIAEAVDRVGEKLVGCEE